MWRPQSVLSNAWVYRAFQRAVGVDRFRAEYIKNYVRPTPGANVLDIGCGPADILDSLPGVSYVGVDLSPRYIQDATARYGSRGQFVCQSVTEFVVQRPASFDLVLANAVLHHLDDREAAALFCAARSALKPRGRLVSFDGCFVAGQSRIASWMLRSDRGQYVRYPEEYVRLASASFPRVEQHVHHDLLRIPYSHIIMVCCANESP